MSDSYITIVPTGVTNEKAKELSKKSFDWLIEKEIISKEKTDCVLGQNFGYAPGLRYKDIIDGDDFGLLNIKTNGLEFILERRVFDSGENELEEINCPNCGFKNIDSEWGEKIGSWINEENDKINCQECDNDSSITDYIFEPTWGLGEFGLTFWNWPSLTLDFLNELRKLFDTDIKVINGRL
ncbi:MAG: hypothetical protein RLO81_04755 [Fulvivirga sp.]|uniref:hypothetical protein n=1 Tax=Fulvivirga sp. TaxID=1931237 RepID=UPI0032ECC59E